MSPLALLLRRLPALSLVPLVASSAHAQVVDLAFSPPTSLVRVGDPVRIQLLTFSSELSAIPYSALDAILDYDPAYLALVGVDDTGAAQSWFVSAFLPDPDGLNEVLTDGAAIYTALCVPGTPALAPPAGALVTTLEFVALAETPGTPLALTPSAGAYAETAVYAYDEPGGRLTGDIGDVAWIQIAPDPTPYCFGLPSDCPCGNAGQQGAGCANSTGLGGLLDASGTTSVSADDLVLEGSSLPPGQFGLFIVGGGQNDIVFGDGLRCVAPGPTGLNRFNPPVLASPAGTMTRGPGLVAHSEANFPMVGHLAAGSTYYFQAWYRDPFGPCGSGFNLTSALEVLMTP